MNKIFKKIRKVNGLLFQKQGMTLVETVVAISIVSVGVIAILAVGLMLLSLGGQSAERIISTNLAREGIEIMMAIRNSERLDPNETWPYSLEDGLYAVNFYSTSPGSDLTGSCSVENISSCNSARLCLQTSGDYERSYTHSCSQDEVFRRLVKIEAGDSIGGCSDCEKKITSVVYWQERGRTHTITLEARVSDWR